MSTILDFQIQPLSAESYSLTVCERSSSQPLASATFSHRVDFLTDFSVDRLNASTKDAADRFDELQKLGQELYQKLFPPAVEQVWHEYKQRSEFLILCLRFADEAAKLEVLPWETLHDGAEFIAAGAKTTLTRLPLGIAPPSELPPIPRPLRLFGFFASPLDLGDHERLNAEREQEILLEAINDPAGQGRISADFEDEAKLEILARSLRGQSVGYHILHFTGHGISPRDGGGLLLEDAHGKKLPASIAEVMQAVASGVDKLRLAVISGCQTARTLHTGAFNDLARELLRQRVPAVIAMQFSITDDGGLKFAEVLYREIAKGVELERAVHAARRVLLEDKQFFINNDALAIVLLAADGACLQTTEAQVAPPQAEPTATYLGDRLDPLAHGFYGRRREYRKIRDALQHQNQRAVIIHGIGGIGKTALLTHAINRLRPRFKDVMSFDCRRAALAPETILLELHRYFAAQGMPQLQSLIGQNAPPETLADEIARMLTEWPLLIVFDNFESQLGEQRDFINEDLRVFLTTLVRVTATGSRFLFTTRYLFDLDGEQLGNLQELPLGDFSRPEAMMLMQKLPNLAQAAHDDKLAALDKFGSHPFSLVTVDKHCQFSRLAEVLDKVSQLHTELREYLGIELNCASLSDRSRELLHRLAAFRQPVPTEAVEWVMGEKVSQVDEVDRILASLDRNKLPDEWKQRDDAALRAQIEAELPEQRSAPNLEGEIRELIEWGLLTPVSEDGGVQAFAIHSLVREFCRDRQAGEGWRECLREAAAFYTNFTRMNPADRKDEIAARIEMEAFELLMEAEDYTAAAHLLEKNTELLARRGFGRDLESKYRRLLNKVSEWEEAMVLNNFATILQYRGEHGKALQCYERSLRIYEEFGDRKGVANLLHNIGALQQNRGEYGEAQQCYERSLRIYEELNDRAGVANLLHNIGALHQMRGEYEEALQRYKQSLRVQEELGNHASVANSLHNIGVLHQMRGEYEKALRYYQRSLRIKEELGNRASIARTISQIGNIHREREEYPEALQCYQQLLQIAEELDNRADIAKALHGIGNINYFCGEYSEALRRYEQSLQVLKQLDDHAGAARLLHDTGVVYLQRKEYLEALQCHEQSLQIQKELRDHAGVAGSLHQLGLLHQYREEYEKAFQCYMQSLQIHEKLDNQAGVASSYGQIGALFMEAERYEEAFRLLMSALLIWFQMELMQSPNARITTENLSTLRSLWGEQAFDAAWRAFTGKDVQEWMEEASDEAS